jgi:hypothetical protein
MKRKSEEEEEEEEEEKIQGPRNLGTTLNSLTSTSFVFCYPNEFVRHSYETFINQGAFSVAAPNCSLFVHIVCDLEATKGREAI